MIWIVFVILLAVAGAYLMLPFVTRANEDVPQALDEARRQRDVVDLDEAEGRLSAQAAVEARDALDRRILALLDAPEQTRTGERLKSMALILVPAILLLGGVGVYTQVGSPNYQPMTMAEFQQQQIAELPDTLDELVVELKARLEADPNPPADGYVLLARSYLRLGDVENGMTAYDTALELSGNDDEIVAERDRVLQMLQDRSAAPQLDPETRAEIEAMSAEEQMAMIEGMVSGLAARLAEDPDDFDGWMRLIRARAVMGDIDQARLDLAAAQAVFAPDTQEGQVLQQVASELLPPDAESAE
ncbi:MAG: c-type cytochrome biogenesis protein CcmI [Hyphomonadaceae bacterium]|nr:c-type cytochrome biogenesis protein CcmI [Hyphomonadaceae bacterium]